MSRKPPNAGKGRVKGVQNRFTASMKDAVMLAFDGIGGVQALTEWARENQSDFYRLCSRLIPQQVQGHITTEVVKVADASELAGVLSASLEKRTEPPDGPIH